jgi:hypothetical protein
MSPYDADVDTAVLRLSPELLAALRRRRVLPYVLVMAILVVVGALGLERRTREFFVADWHRSIASVLEPERVVGTTRVGSTVAVPPGSATAKPSDAVGHSEVAAVVVIPPAEVLASAAMDESRPWKSAGMGNRRKARTKAGPGRR